MTVDLADADRSGRDPDADRERLRVHRGARLGPPAELPAVQRHPRRRALALDARRRHASSTSRPRSRATAWPSTTTATCSSASRSSSCLVRFRDGKRELVAHHYERHVPQQPERRGHARLRRQHLLHRPRLRALERLDRPGADAERRRLQRRLPRAARRRRARARRRRGRVRPPERPLLLARREAALRQRLGQPRRSRSSTSPPTARSGPRA